MVLIPTCSRQEQKQAQQQEQEQEQQAQQEQAQQNACLPFLSMHTVYTAKMITARNAWSSDAFTPPVVTLVLYPLVPPPASVSAVNNTLSP